MIVRHPAVLGLSLAVAATGLLPTSATGQSLSDRIDRVRQQQAQQQRQQAARAPQLSQLLRMRINFDVQQIPAQDAVRAWSRLAQVPVVINWPAMENQGIDPQTPVTLQLSGVPAGRVFGALLDQLAPEDRLIVDPAERYLRVSTQRDADRRTVTRIYPVQDLLVEVPQFEGPEFGLQQALSNTESGGGTGFEGNNGGGGGFGGGGGGGLFDPDAEPGDTGTSVSQRGEALAQLVRDTIEPEIWQANGGEHAAVRYQRGLLIITAPLYAHRQIGRANLDTMATPAPGSVSRSTASAGSPHRSNVNRAADVPPVAGINTEQSNRQDRSGKR